MKYKLILLILANISAFCSFSQTPNWAWAKSSGGNNGEKSNSVTTDAAGNIYITGGFSSDSISFGSTTLYNVIGAPSIQFFIAKYDPAGNALWAKSAGGLAPDEGNGIVADNSGNIYATGYFQSDTVIFGAYTLVNSMTDYSSDIFIVKYDTNGNVLWAKSSGGNRYDYGHGIGTDSNGNVYVSGRFMSDSISLDAINLVNRGDISAVIGLDLFITKLSPSGNVIWANRAGGIGGESGEGLTVDAFDNIYMTGTYGSDSIHFGAFTLANTHDSTTNYGNVFIVKYNTSGNVLWAKNSGGTFSDEGNCVTTDLTGNVFVTGFFFSKTFTIGTTTLVNADTTGMNFDMFLLKYDASGNFLWANSAGGNDYDEGMGATTDNLGNTYVTGYYSSISCSFGTTTLVNSGSAFTPNIFLAKYDAAGNLLYAYTPAGNSVDEGHGLTTDITNNIYMTGFYRSTNTIFGATTLPQAGYGDVFLAKLLPEGVGISENLNKSLVKIYPNPSGSIVTIEFPENASEVSIVNSLGQLIRTEQIKEQHVLTYETEKSGIYHIVVKTNNGMISKKLIVIR